MKGTTPWTCPRCGRQLTAHGKGGHGKIHWRDQVCEDASGCENRAGVLRADGKVTCWLHFTATKGLK